MDPQDTTITPEELESGDDQVVLDAGDDTTTLPAGDETPELEAGDDAIELPEAVDTPPAKSTKTGDPNTLMALQGVINRQSSKLDELKTQIRQVNEGLKSILENDQELSKAEEEMKAVAKVQKERKASLSNSAESMQLKYKLKEIRETMKDLEESLNNHLLNYYDLTGVKVIDTDDGGQREFSVRAKLMAKKQEKQ